MPEEVLLSSGYEDVASVELCEMKWFNVKSGDTLHDVLLNGASRTTELLLGQSPDEANAVKSLTIKKYDSITDSERLPLSMPAMVSSGTKPPSSHHSYIMRHIICGSPQTPRFYLPRHRSVSNDKISLATRCRFLTMVYITLAYTETRSSICISSTFDIYSNQRQK